MLYNGFTLGERFSGFRSLKIDLKDVYRRVILYDCAQSASAWGKRRAKNKKRMNMQSYEKWVATCLFLHPKEKDALRCLPACGMQFMCFLLYIPVCIVKNYLHHIHILFQCPKQALLWRKRSPKGLTKAIQPLLAVFT